MAGLVANSTASSSRGHGRTRIGRPFQTGGLRRRARPSARAGSTGRSGRAPGGPRCASAISVPNSGRPVMNDLVPSIGSSTQTNSASAPLGAVLLAEDAVIRVGGLDQLAHPRLGLAVGDRHRAGVGLGLDRRPACGNSGAAPRRRSRRADAPAPRTRGRGARLTGRAAGGSAARQRCRARRPASAGRRSRRRARRPC